MFLLCRRRATIHRHGVAGRSADEQFSVGQPHIIRPTYPHENRDRLRRIAMLRMALQENSSPGKIRRRVRNTMPRRRLSQTEPYNPQHRSRSNWRATHAAYRSVANISRGPGRCGGGPMVAQMATAIANAATKVAL